MITLDTSGLLALIDRRDSDHQRCVSAFDADEGPYLIPAPILAEIGYLLEQRYPSTYETTFLADCSDGAYSVLWDGSEIARIEMLVARYVDLPLGIADASVVACAERYGGRILSVDHHFAIVARGEPGIEVVPAL